MKCLQCGKPAKHTENYQGIPIGTCEDGHRTGSIDAPLEAQSEVDGLDWLRKAS